MLRLLSARPAAPPTAPPSAPHTLPPTPRLPHPAPPSLRPAHSLAHSTPHNSALPARRPPPLPPGSTPPALRTHQLNSRPTHMPLLSHSTLRPTAAAPLRSPYSTGPRAVPDSPPSLPPESADGPTADRSVRPQTAPRHTTL